MTKKKSKSVGDNESFVHLICAAQDDKKFRRELIAILRQPSFQRKSMLNYMIQAMTYDGVEESIIEAALSLTDDVVASRVLALLEETE